MSYNVARYLGLCKLRAKIAHRLVYHQVQESKRQLQNQDPGSLDGTAPGFEKFVEPTEFTKIPLRPPNFPVKVGIVGAGMTGLYTAMILDDIDSEIKYEILEASERSGGRIYTHYFSNPETPGDYYDVGAMRFPDIPIMRRTFDLFKRLRLDFDRSPPQVPKERGKLIPYYFSGPWNPRLYNNILDPGTPDGEGEDKGDTFHVSVTNCGTVPDIHVAEGTKKILRNLYDPWKSWFIDDFDAAWKALMDLESEVVTTRAKLLKCLSHPCIPRGHPSSVHSGIYYTTNWVETMEGSTGSFEAGFPGAVIHSLEFDWPGTPDSVADPLEKILGGENVWWCVNGGADIITQRMLARIRRKPLLRHKVNKITLVKQKDQMTVDAQTPDGDRQETYTHVINTTTFGCAQTIDLRDAGLNYAQREAIRVLGYARAVKVGIKFTSRWWAREKGPEGNGIVRGGLGKTDRPTRTVVYPSYALDTPPAEPGVLLACYNTAQDAGRVGAMKEGSSATDQELLYSCIIADLAAMHNRTEQELRAMTVGYHVHDWDSDPLTRGSWGDFGPGQYPSFFGHIKRPAARGHLFFGSEATSIYPGWVVGSLNSAYRCVRQMLLCQIHNSNDPVTIEYLRYLLFKLKVNWGGEDIEPLAEDEEDVLGTEGWQIFLGIAGAELGL